MQRFEGIVVTVTAAARRWRLEGLPSYLELKLDFRRQWPRRVRVLARP